MTAMNELSEANSPLDTSPRIIQMRLGFLIRQYMQTRIKERAKAVVRQLEILLRHPDCIGYPDNRCGYKKMLVHWRVIAG